MNMKQYAYLLFIKHICVFQSSVLAVGYVMCQSLCIRRKLFEIDHANLENWRNKLIVNPQIQASRLLSQLLPAPKYVLPVSKQHVEPKDNSEDLVDSATNVEQPYGPITAQEVLSLLIPCP